MFNFSNRISNLQEVIRGFHKEDNINTLTKQTLFDHPLLQCRIKITRSAKVNVVDKLLRNSYLRKAFN